MNISLEELTKINKVQIEILEQIACACRALDIKFFVVHGTLLGTIRDQSFIPYDDDIDIAMERESYERFLAQAPALMGDGYFVQSHVSDPAYPLEFAKVRDSRTTYIVENVRHIPMNQGIYVDVFPMDFARTGRWSKLLYKLFNLRVSCLYRMERMSVASKIKRLAISLLIPSVRWAVKQRDNIAKRAPVGQFVCMTGGKAVEKRMPAQWFANYEPTRFEGVEVYVPAQYDEYLTHIYGDYSTRTLVEGKMADEEHVVINACIVDAERPYTDYMDSKRTRK